MGEEDADENNSAQGVKPDNEQAYLASAATIVRIVNIVNRTPYIKDIKSQTKANLSASRSNGDGTQIDNKRRKRCTNDAAGRAGEITGG